MPLSPSIITQGFGSVYLKLTCVTEPKIWNMWALTAQLCETDFNDNISCERRGHIECEWVIEWVSKSVRKWEGDWKDWNMQNHFCCYLQFGRKKVRPWITESQCVWLKNVQDEFCKRKRTHEAKGNTQKSNDSRKIHLHNMKFNLASLHQEAANTDCTHRQPTAEI